MNRHSFRWEPLVFGLLFLAVVANWAIWRAGLLSADQLVYAAAAGLILLGAVGIVASIAAPRHVPTLHISSEEASDEPEEADPQP
ncbi:MAG TPA: hypothetical protein VK948_07705 [Aeromicrobium sp.]|nr:hypothetical protein [Aeromicrobium sp.]